MTNQEATDRITATLLTNPHIGGIHSIHVFEANGEITEVATSLVAIGISQLDDLPPLLAGIRAQIREAVPTARAIFIEPDCSRPQPTNIATESVVIRSAD